jgi:hypothetical protein
MRVQTWLRLLLASLAILSIGVAPMRGQSAAAAADRVPLYFEENQGQTAGEVRYLARGPGYTAYLTGRETVFQYRTGKPGRKEGKEAVVRMTLSGSKAPASIQGGGRLPGIVNYLIGNDPSQWHSSIPTYSEVDYRGVYPGVDLVYRGAGKRLEFDFRVAPGADPNKIRLAYTGASKMHLDAGGDLFLDTDAGPAPFTKPAAYQEIDGKRVPVAANFKLLANGEVGFRLGKYDRKRQLTIDPVSGPSVYYSTYLGSGSGDTFARIAVDPAGQAFICGYTDFSSYPTTTAVSGGFPNGYHAAVGFVTALAADGTGLIYSTFVSGHGSSASVGAQLQAIAVDANGNAFVGGYTDDATFPLVSAFQNSFTGYTAGIVFELNSTGQRLVYSSFLGGKSTDSDSIAAIAVDSSDNAYVTGSNTVAGAGAIQSSHFPTTSGVIWGDFSQWNNESGSNNGFAVKINSAGSEVWATLIGAQDYTHYVSGGFGYNLGCNSSYTSGTGIAVDASGNVYVTGTSSADISDHGGTITRNLNMGNVSRGCTFESQSYEFSSEWSRTNTFVVELNSTATTAVYIAYLGGNSPIVGQNENQGTTGTGPITSASGIAVDSNGLAYVTGTTQASNFQTTSNAYHATPYLAGSNGPLGLQYDDYVTVIDADGTGFAYSTYLNGTNVTSAALNEGYDGSPGATGIVLGTGGQFAISGFADTTNFPTTAVPVADVPLLQSFPSGKDYAMFITKFGPVGTLTAGNGLVYSVFVGAGGEYTVDGVASNGTDVYVMLELEPTNGLTTGGAYDANNSSGQKDLIVRVLDAAPMSTSITVNSASAQPSTSAQTVGLTSTVSASSTVNEGTVTYYITNSSNAQIGSTVTSGIVSGGSAPTTNYTLPANSPTGTYTIHASYNHAGGFLNSSGTGTLTVANTVAVTIASSPSGLSFGVSGTGCSPGTGLTTPQTLQWTPGSTCAVTFASPQGGPGTQYVFNQWADNNSNNPRTFSVPSSATTYTADFTTQYQLTTAASPSGGGTVTPSSGQYYNSGAVVNLQANANNGYVFANWTGSVQNANSAATTVTMSGAESVTANFSANVNVTIASMPSGLAFSTSGPGCTTASGLTTPLTLQWTPNSSCTVAFGSPQAGGSPSPGTQYVFSSWADGPTAASRSINTPASAATYTANFTTQYQLTTGVSPVGAGTVTPPSGWVNAGTVNLQANTNSGYVFANWTGASVQNANSASTTINMTGPATVTANFNVNVNVTSSPTGLAFSTSGPGCATTSGLSTPQTLAWVPSSTCTVIFAATIPGATGTQYVFNQWEDSSTNPARTITAPTTPGASYTASFTTQYQLTTVVWPVGAGTVTPLSGWVNAGVVNLQASNNSGYVFANWTGASVQNANSASTTFNMTGPAAVTANFNVNVTIASTPTGLAFSTSGPGCATTSGLTTPQTQAWVPNSTCTVTFAATIPGATGTQYVFNQWENGSNNPVRTITAPTTPGASYTASFTTQYLLTTAASPAAAGSVTPTSGYVNAGVVNLQANTNTGYVFANWTGASVQNANSASTTINVTGPATVTANFNVNVTIGSSPSGLSFSTNGPGCSTYSGNAPQTLVWVPGSSCTVTFTSTQSGNPPSPGTQYIFSAWADGPTAASRMISTPASATTYTANFNTQYQLTTAVSPSGEGTVTPTSGQYYNSGTQANLQATANTGYAFGGWTSSPGTANSPSSASTYIVMSAVESVTANFVPQATINSSPSGLPFTVSGTGCSAGSYAATPMTLAWTPGSSCTVTFAATVAAGSPTQFVFTQWQDNSSTNPVRTIPAGSSPASYTANFQTQYLLTTQVSPSTTYGSISPTTEYVNAGATPQVSAAANLGFGFTGFTGALSGATPQNLPALTGPVTVIASFVALPDLAIVSSHTGNFDQGQLGATYTLMVGNNGPGSTSGTVMVTETLPSGLTLVSMSGSGWTCGAPNPANVCITGNIIGMGGSYQPITVTVNVATNASASVTNMASVSVAGDYNSSNNTSMDPTTINPIVNVSSQVSVTPTGFARNHATGIWSATVTVTNTSSTPISGPIQVELTNLSTDATMTNNTGTFNLSPYITVSSGALAVGASASVTIQFQNPSNGSITFTPVTVSGTF